MTLFHEIDSKINGHVCMYENESDFLEKLIKDAGNGDHLEIGSMWGGSAIVAALTKKRLGLSGHVVCVDPFRDGDCSPGFPGGHPDVNIFWKNMETMGVSDMVELVCAYSDPWPLGDRQFASILVDGDHAGDWPLIDWLNSKNHANMVIYHDLYPHERDVMYAVEIIRSVS